MEILNLRDNYDEALLKDVYNGLYIKYFPETTERLPIEFFIKSFNLKINKDGYIINFFICGDNLENPYIRIIKGFLIIEYYSETEIGLLTYLAIDKQYRNNNGVHLMLEQMKIWLQEISSGNIKVILAETHNPNKIDFVDTIDPTIRLKIFKKHGLQYIPIRYVMPPLFLGSVKNDKLFLVAFHPTEKFTQIVLSKKLLKNFLFNFYKICDIEDPYSDLDFVNMINSIDEIDLKETDLLPSIIFKE